MPGTASIGDGKYTGPNGSVLPPDSRQCKRLLKSLGSVRVACRALVDALSMVQVVLPSPNPSAVPLDPVLEALQRNRDTDVANADPPENPEQSEQHRHAVHVATTTLRRIVAETVEAMLADSATLKGYVARRGRSYPQAEERLGLLLHLAIDRAVTDGIEVMQSETQGDGASNDDKANDGEDREGENNNDHGDEREDTSNETSHPEGKNRKRKSGYISIRKGSRAKRKKSMCEVDCDYSDEEDDLLDSNGNDVERFNLTSEDRDRAFATRRTASICLEALHLQVMSRTTATWGKKKKYEVYQFPRPVRPIADGGGVQAVNSAVEKEFRATFRGGGEDQCGIRVYGMLRKVDLDSDDSRSRDDSSKEHLGGTYLFLHLCIGKPLDLFDESTRSISTGTKKKKKANEFIAIMRPGTTLFALSASRAPSQSRFTPYVLASLVNAVCSNTGTPTMERSRRPRKMPMKFSHFAQLPIEFFPLHFLILIQETNLTAERVGDLSGSEPFDLILSASSSIHGTTIGRFSRYSEDLCGNSSVRGSVDPLVAMNQAATGTLLSREAEQRRLKTAAKHDKEIANMHANIAGLSNETSSFVAANRAGMIVDHSAASAQSMKRSGENDLGRSGECPRLDRMSWKWAGDTMAASKCWEDDDDAFKIDVDNSDQKELSAQLSTKFKCGIIMEGPDVFGGLRALISAGVAKAPLPNYVRDAAGAGTKTVTVKEGAFGAADSLEAV